MSRSMLKTLINESRAGMGSAISFIDIDETTFHTFAKVLVMKGDEIVRELSNQEFNTYKLGDNETYGFAQFRDAKVFNKTSTPIDKTVNRIKNMINSIKRYNTNDRVIFLTARTDFDDKEMFLDTFRSIGIDVDIPSVHVERSGNLTDIDTVSGRKNSVILKYLNTGIYSVVRMYDDDINNLINFKELGEQINDGKAGILDKVIAKNPMVRQMNFYPLLVSSNGTARLFK